MAKFLTTRGTTSEIEKIINNAKKSVVLISPFVRIPYSLFQNLIAADKRDVRITLIYGKKGLESDVYEQLKQLKNLHLCYLENLHAKCYFNEESMVITSLNLYDFSEQNNREMGILITRQEEQEVYIEGLKEVQRVYKISQVYDVTKELLSDKFHSAASVTAEEQELPGTTLLRGFADILLDKVGFGRGFCIGCKARIDYDEYRPFCPDCYKQWSKNKRQKASYCHFCGRVATSSINKPVCRFCWEKTIEYR